MTGREFWHTYYNDLRMVEMRRQVQRMVAIAHAANMTRTGQDAELWHGTIAHLARACAISRWQIAAFEADAERRLYCYIVPRNAA